MIQKRIHIFVTGRVQGVFFRQSTRVMAIKNNVNGWVRNLDDGRVEIVAEGEKQNIDNLVNWCQTGPANSRVDEFELFDEKVIEDVRMHRIVFCKTMTFRWFADMEPTQSSIIIKIQKERKTKHRQSCKLV